MMTNILLHIHDDDAAQARMQAALDLARALNGHLSCLHVTPFNNYIASDVFGGVYVLPDVMAAVAKHSEKMRADIQAQLSREDVAWSYEGCDGDPAAALVDRARLADFVVLSRATRDPAPNEPLPLAGDVAVHTRALVLAVPPAPVGFDACGAAFIAWNGSIEAANALKASLPMLKLASAINIVTVVEDATSEFPATDGAEYLSRHGLKAAVHSVDRNNRSAGEALLGALADIGGAYVVMGAYGHSRARELLLGGVTRHMLKNCPVPLLLAH
jgi:nucleotide-binding universal stress UspA family protein